MSTPALIARAAASVRSAAKPWVTRFRTALASLTTKPSNPHVSRSTSVNSQRLPDAGTPLRSMYAVITLPGAGLDRRLERREVHVPELGVGQVDLVVVAPTERAPVAGEVLRTGNDVVRCAQLTALEAAHLGDGHRRAEVRVFSRALDDPTPTWIARDVDHRRERPVDADGTRLTGGDRLATLDRLGIPGGRHRNRHRKNRAEPVDHVESEQHGDAEAITFDREPLQAVDLGRIGDEQQ